MEKGTKESCRCPECVECCRRKPGWFAPGEAERAAELVGQSLEEFFRRSLMVDYWVERPGVEDTLVLSPAVVGGLAGGMFGFNPLGACVFLSEEGACAINTAKPMECREVFHEQTRSDLHAEMARRWRSPEAQAWLRVLLAGEAV